MLVLSAGNGKSSIAATEWFQSRSRVPFASTGALSFDAVKHLVLCRLEGRPPRLDLDLYPYLPRVRVSATSAQDYMTLLSGRAA